MKCFCCNGKIPSRFDHIAGVMRPGGQLTCLRGVYICLSCEKSFVRKGLSKTAKNFTKKIQNCVRHVGRLRV